MKRCTHIEACELALEPIALGFRCSLCGAEFIDVVGGEHLREATAYEKMLADNQPPASKIGDTLTIKRPERYVTNGRS